MLTLDVGNDNLIELQNLKNTATDVVDTGATCELRLKDRGGNDIPGQAFPIAMSHIADGLYQGVLSDALQIRANRKYIVVVTADGSSGEAGLWEVEAVARTRRS